MKQARARRRRFKRSKEHFACIQGMDMFKTWNDQANDFRIWFRSLRLGCVGVLVDTIRINVACDYLNDDLVDLFLKMLAAWFFCSGPLHTVWVITWVLQLQIGWFKILGKLDTQGYNFHGLAKVLIGPEGWSKNRPKWQVWPVRTSLDSLCSNGYILSFRTQN